jgi:MFS family permease
MHGLVTRLRPRGALWHNGDFRFLWAAQTVSEFGSQVTGLALPLVAILVLDASIFEVAVLAVVNWLPFFLFSLVAGVWIDRLPRRPILVAADWGRAVVLGTIPLAYLLDLLTLGQLGSPARQVRRSVRACGRKLHAPEARSRHTSRASARAYGRAYVFGAVSPRSSIPGVSRSGGNATLTDRQGQGAALFWWRRRVARRT